MNSPFHLAGSVAVVSGAGSGLGRATAALLRERGAEVVGLDLRPPAGPTDTTCLEVDVTSSTQVVRAMERVADLAGPLRVVVCCAGTAPAERLLGRRGAHTTRSFRRTLAVNLTGTAHVLHAAVSLMLRQQDRGVAQGGLVVCTASVAAFEGQVGQVAYASAKAGVVGLVEDAATTLADRGIRVNAIAPGTFDTPMAAAAGPGVLERISAGIPHPSRLGRPEEYAALVLALVDSPSVSGQTVRLDGALRLAIR